MLEYWLDNRRRISGNPAWGKQRAEFTLKFRAGALSGILAKKGLFAQWIMLRFASLGLAIRFKPVLSGGENGDYRRHSINRRRSGSSPVFLVDAEATVHRQVIQKPIRNQLRLVFYWLQRQMKSPHALKASTRPDSYHPTVDRRYILILSRCQHKASSRPEVKLCA